MNLDAMIRGKLGEICALSPWTEDSLDDMLALIDAYAKEKYQEGYNAALSDAEDLAERVSVGVQAAS